MRVSGTRHSRHSQLLHILTKEFGHDKIGLYRDDGLGCFQSLPGHESENV